MRKLTLFDDWLEEAENRMEYIGTTDDKDKLILLRTWGDSEIKDLIKRQTSIVNIKKEDTTINAQNEGSVDPVSPPATSYQETVRAIRELLLKLVNRTMAMNQLLTTKQGNGAWNDFIQELETRAKTLNFDEKPYTIEEAIKDAAIFGMNDPQLREKALAEDPSLENLSRWGQAGEAGR